MKTINTYLTERLKLNINSKIKEPWSEFIYKDIFIDDLMKLNTKFKRPITFKHGMTFEKGDLLLIEDFNLLMYIINEVSDEDTGEIYYKAIQCGGTESDKKIFIEYVLVDKECREEDMMFSIGSEKPDEELKINRFYLNPDEKTYKQFLNDFKCLMDALYNSWSDEIHLNKIQSFNRYICRGISIYEFIQNKDVINRR